MGWVILLYLLPASLLSLWLGLAFFARFSGSKELLVFSAPPFRTRLEKVAQLFQQTNPQFTVRVFELPAPANPSTTALIVNYQNPAPDPSTPVRQKAEIIFYDYRLVAVPFLDPTPGLSRAEALALLRASPTGIPPALISPAPASSGSVSPWSDRKILTEEQFLRQGRLTPPEVALLTWPSVNLNVKLLPIDGRFPWPKAIANGDYPLSFPVGIRILEAKGLMTFLGRWLPALSRSQKAAAAFLDFLRSPTAQTVFYPGSNGIQLTAVGDLMLDRGVAAKMVEHGLSYPLSLTAQRLASADITLANLESPLGTKGKPIPNKGIWFRAKPEAVAVLQQGGIDIVTLANNHILDYDSENLLETMEILSAHQIAFTGAGKDLAAARRPRLLEVKIPGALSTPAGARPAGTPLAQQAAPPAGTSPAGPPLASTGAPPAGAPSAQPVAPPAVSGGTVTWAGAVNPAYKPLGLQGQGPAGAPPGPQGPGPSGTLRIAFLGYSDFAEIFWSYQYPRTFSAGPDRPGVAPIKEAFLREDIARARQQADLVVVAFHWGQEYTSVPVPFKSDQRAVAHLAIDAGADLVLGFHPHAVQGFEIYRGRFIAYSLGNFVMDQRSEITRESMILEFWVDPQGVKNVNIVPVMIEKHRPRVLEGAEGRRLLEKFAQISQRLH